MTKREALEIIAAKTDEGPLVRQAEALKRACAATEANSEALHIQADFRVKAGRCRGARVAVEITP